MDDEPGTATDAYTSYVQRRRRRIQLMTIRGLSERQIAAVAGVTPETVREDQRWNALNGATNDSLLEERVRLLGASKQVEHEAWEIFRSLPGSHVAARLDALNTVLTAHAKATEVIGLMDRQALLHDLAGLGEVLLSQIRDGKIFLGAGFDGGTTRPREPLPNDLAYTFGEGDASGHAPLSRAGVLQDGALDTGETDGSGDAEESANRGDTAKR
jgi:DNA-binding CsgD family transcriptional regulator